MYIMTTKGYSTIAISSSIRKKLDDVRKKEGLASYTQALVYIFARLEK